MAGVDQFGGNNDAVPVIDAYNMPKYWIKKEIFIQKTCVPQKQQQPIF